MIGVQRGFPADVAGISRFDVITKINQAPVNSLDVIKSAQAAQHSRIKKAEGAELA